jgi:HEPN domain-containing protein
MARKWDPPADWREWSLNRARGNLARAQNVTVGPSLEDLCFEAQQAAEKAIKGVFIQRGVIFPYIHDLKDLLQRLEHSGVRIPKYVKQADELTPYTVLTRYPRLGRPFTQRQYRRAVRIAESVLRWAERRIGRP